MDEMTLTLNSPITEEQWDMIEDVDFDHTDSITFYTKHGKKVEFAKRKTGKWNRRKGMYEVGFKCSECNSFSIAETPYCSFCGARMLQEGEGDETD